MIGSDQGWERDGNRLTLRLGKHVAPVPTVVAELLIGADGVGLSPCSTVDVLALETRLRYQVARLSVEHRAADQAVRAARFPADVDAPQPQVSAAIREACRHRNGVMARLRASSDALRALRAWIVAAEPGSGWLAEAAAGWVRGSEPPTTVTVFTEAAFLAGDPRRVARTARGGCRIDGVEAWGQEWRRDGDDDDPERLAAGGVDRAGPWALGLISRTGELYAVRRAGHLPSEVWLLGRSVEARESAVELLGSIRLRMREPNSVVAAADIVGDAMGRRAS